MFSIIVFVSLVVEYCEITEGSIEVACDGIEALISISLGSHTTKGGSNSFDMVDPA
jgi:hypothetical protein